MNIGYFMMAVSLSYKVQGIKQGLALIPCA